MGLGDSLKGNLAGALRMGAHLATGPLHSFDRRTWGASEAEVNAVLPGDELLDEVSWRSTRAVSIWATPDRVWPWLVQIGRGRAGFYSNQLLENLAGSLEENAETIQPQWQDLQVGDEVRLHDKLPPLVVAQIVPGQSLVLQGIPDEASPLAKTVWSYHLLPVEGGKTRLVERNAYQHGDSLTERLVGGPYVVEAVSFVMSREMLLNIKRLAEAGA